jgi:hypothetical protein
MEARAQVHQDLTWTIQEIVAGAGAAAAVLLARVVNRRLSRLVLTLTPKLPAAVPVHGRRVSTVSHQR